MIIMNYMYNIVCILILMFLTNNVFSQERIDILPIIHYEDYKVDDYMGDWINERKALCTCDSFVLKACPYNSISDTIFAIEVSGFGFNSSFEAMYWSSRFVYSISGVSDKYLNVYDVPIFNDWMISVAEKVSQESICNHCADYLYDGENYVHIIRIIIDSGRISTESMFAKNLVHPYLCGWILEQDTRNEKSIQRIDLSKEHGKLNLLDI